MKEDDFSIGTRRATRVAVRIPLQITVRTSSGIAETVSAWTLVVNMYGARCESKRRFELNEQVEIVNSLNNQKIAGKVVWCESRPDGTGKFEFAVELHEPSNLWHISFPPRDWKEAPKSTPERNAIASPSTKPEAKHQQEPAAVEIESDESAPHIEPLQPMAAIAEEVQRSIETSTPDTDLTADAVTAFEPAADAPDAVAESFQAIARPALLPDSSLRAPKPPAPQPAEAHDRLIQAVSELVESALRTSIETETNRLVESRVAQLADRARKIAVETLRQIAEAAEERSRTAAQLAEEAAAASLNSLRDRVLQQMPPIEDQITGRCKSETEQLASAAVDKVRHMLSDQLDEFSEKLAQREQAVFDSMAAAEKHRLEALERTASRLEAQLAESAKASLENWSRSLIESINTTHQHLLMQAEARIDEASEKGMRDTRNGLARSLRELADIVSAPSQADRALRDAVSSIFTRPFEEDANGNARRTAEKDLPRTQDPMKVSADAPFPPRRVVRL